MATRKKPNSAPKKRSDAVLSQLGLLDMPGLNDDDEIGNSDDDGGDDDLEAELQAIMSGKAPIKKPKAPPKKPVNMMNIEMMANQAMRDIPSDEDDDQDDENLSENEELMAELKFLSPGEDSGLKRESSPSPPPPVPPKVRSVPTGSAAHVPAQVSVNQTPQNRVLEERLKSYKDAEAAAKAIGETTKARRFNRGVKTLETLIRESKNGRAINEDDIPPAVVLPKQSVPRDLPDPTPILQPTSPSSPAPASLPPASPPPTSPAPSSPDSSQPPPLARRTPSQKRTDNTMATLTTRRDQYKMAALNAKKTGDMKNAMNYVKMAKQFDVVIDALNKGQPVDLSKMPPPPPGFVSQTTAVAPNAPAIPQRMATAVPPTTNSAVAIAPIPEENQQLNLPDEPEDPNLFDAPPPPSTILEALTQRLEKYKLTMTAATAENNTSKAKRLGRIVKQYEDAIKCFKAGKPVDYESLPAPPGFGSIPGIVLAASAGPSAPAGPAGPAPAKTPANNKPPVNNNAQNKTLSPKPTPVDPNKPAGRSPNSVLDKQLNFLSERMRLFREAALESKKKGDIKQAKEYLRMAKGIEPMIEATKCGLPIDATSIPTPPQLSEEFSIVEQTDCLPEDWKGDKEELFRSLEIDLIRQIEICQRNKDHFMKLGDVSSASKFEKLGQDTKRDLTVVQHLWQKGESLPKFHYETRLFSMVQCHSNLGDNDVEVSVLRGINLPGKPNELDSYVRVEFPYPAETPQKVKTHTIKDTNNPEYNETFKFEMNRKSRSLARVFKRHSVKFEVWSKGGFLRSDALLGVAQMKLDVLEQKCLIHDCFDLLDGRKACGGKIEAKLCIRDPLLVKQVEEVKERWLVIGS